MKFRDPFDDFEMPSDVQEGVIPIGKDIAGIVSQ
jgi:hypothetical protein